MTPDAAQEPDSQENWHPRLADCFQVFGTGGERLLPAKLKVSFPTFRWVSCGSGVRRLCVFWRQSTFSEADAQIEGRQWRATYFGCAAFSVHHQRLLTGSPIEKTDVAFSRRS